MASIALTVQLQRDIRLAIGPTDGPYELQFLEVPYIVSVRRRSRPTLHILVKGTFPGYEIHQNPGRRGAEAETFFVPESGEILPLLLDWMSRIAETLRDEGLRPNPLASEIIYLHAKLRSLLLDLSGPKWFPSSKRDLEDLEGQVYKLKAELTITRSSVDESSLMHLTHLLDEALQFLSIIRAAR